jgi:asparagine synthase (glutamine-hydrolysing)
MCGICGIINFDSERAVTQAEIERMDNQLLHRGPDDRGFWLGKRIGLGHTRLSIIDLTQAARQPMSNEDGSIWIIYNGEIYNFQELRKRLESKGHRFKSKSDTEVIIHLYEEEGKECVKSLRGMFAFGIWDEKQRLLFLARDRLGQKPLYYYKDDKRFLFASEIRGLLASEYVEKSIDYEALYQYLCLGYVPHPKTGFWHIKKLLPGHRLMINDAQIRMEPYWSLEKNSDQNERIDERETSERLIALLEETTRIRMVSDVPLGVLLSGGMDSSAVVTMMSRCSKKIKTFTVGFEEKLYDERNEAKYLADKLGTEHYEMVVKPNITDVLPKLVLAYDEPFADPSAIPSYYVAQMARQRVKVVLNGDGGDENFAGYGEYIQGLIGRWTKNIPARIGLYFSRLFGQNEAGKAKSLSQVLALSGRSPAQFFSQLRLMIPVVVMDSLLTPAFRAQMGGWDPIGHLVECYQQFDKGDAVNTMLAVDQRTLLPDDLLYKIDIATMSHGLEARSPFLDHHLVEFVTGLPGNLKLKGWKKKYILKKALLGILPERVLKRRKRGFDVPVGIWLKSELKEFCQDAFSSQSLITEILQKEKLAVMFEDHLSGRKEWGRFFWMILMLHLWSKTFFEGRAVDEG